MSLLPHEQFVLRQIERRLTEADPALAAYLSGRVRWRWLAAVAVIYTVPAVLLGLGVGAHLVAVLVAGALLAPVAAWMSWWALRPGRCAAPFSAKRRSA